MGQSKPQTETQEAPIVAAQTFVLKDARGRERGEFSIKEGMPSISMLDKNGTCRVRLGMCPDGSPQIALFDEEGRDRGSFRVTMEGEPGLVLDRAIGSVAEPAARDPAIVEDDGEGATGSTVAAEPVRPSRMATELFGQHCASCHDSDGSGSGSRSDLPRLPDFRAAEWQASHSNARLLASIVNGRGADMPPFRGDLTDVQTRELVRVVRGFGPATRTVSDLSGGDFNSQFQALEREFDELEQRLQSLRRTRSQR